MTVAHCTCYHGGRFNDHGPLANDTLTRYQAIGDFYALATCNEIGHRRLVDMMTEFDLSQLDDIAAFILENSRRATLERIAALPNLAVVRQTALYTVHRSRLRADTQSTVAQERHQIFLRGQFDRIG